MNKTCQTCANDPGFDYPTNHPCPECGACLRCGSTTWPHDCMKNGPKGRIGLTGEETPRQLAVAIQNSPHGSMLYANGKVYPDPPEDKIVGTLEQAGPHGRDIVAKFDPALPPTNITAASIPFMQAGALAAKQAHEQHTNEQFFRAAGYSEAQIPKLIKFMADAAMAGIVMDRHTMHQIVSNSPKEFQDDIDWQKIQPRVPPPPTEMFPRRLGMASLGGTRLGMTLAHALAFCARSGVDPANMPPKTTDNYRSGDGPKPSGKRGKGKTGKGQAVRDKTQKRSYKREQEMLEARRKRLAEGKKR